MKFYTNYFIQVEKNSSTYFQELLLKTRWRSDELACVCACQCIHAYMCVCVCICVWCEGWGDFHPYVFILRQLYKTLCFIIQGFSHTHRHTHTHHHHHPHHPLQSPFNQMDIWIALSVAERGLIAVKQTTRWCHFSLIMMLPIAVAFIFLSDDAWTTGWGHDSDCGCSTGRLRKQTDAARQLLFRTESRSTTMRPERAT